jgi:PKD repeat protein
VLSFSACEKEEITPSALFTASSTNVKVLENITFTNLSTNASSYQWSFGDGTTSAASSPTHSYSKTGTYTVQLKAFSASGKKMSETSISINVTEIGGNAIFWMSSGDYYVTVTLSNGAQGTITKNFSAIPSCGTTGGANFSDLTPGVYGYYATDGNAYWNSTITIKSNTCSRMQLLYSSSAPEKVKGEQILKQKE